MSIIEEDVEIDIAADAFPTGYAFINVIRGSSFSVIQKGTLTLETSSYLAGPGVSPFSLKMKRIQRAHTFYNTLMAYELDTLEYQGASLAFFKCETEAGVSGSLIKSEGLTPSTIGTMIYLHAGDDLQPYLERANTAGGSVFMEKTELGPGMGFFAIFDDCEGNRVWLYSTG